MGARKIDSQNEMWLNPMHLRAKLEEIQAKDAWKKLLLATENGSDSLAWNIRIATMMVQLPQFWDKENPKEAIDKSITFYKTMIQESSLSKYLPMFSNQSKMNSEFAKYSSLSDNYPPLEQANTAPKEIVDVSQLPQKF
jgi:hypothetical protein